MVSPKRYDDLSVLTVIGAAVGGDGDDTWPRVGTKSVEMIKSELLKQEHNAYSIVFLLYISFTMQVVKKWKSRVS